MFEHFVLFDSVFYHRYELITFVLLACIIEINIDDNNVCFTMVDSELILVSCRRCVCIRKVA